MLLDSQNLFSDSQEITSGTIYSQNVVNFGKNDVSFVPVIIQVVEDFSNLTSLTAVIQTSETAEFAESSDLVESTLKLDELKAGVKFPVKFLPQGNKGYMRIAYVVEGANETTGKITASVVASDGLASHEI